jgi:tetraacyldisaccharide 4'-kinase
MAQYFVDLQLKKYMELKELQGHSVIAFAAIAKPASFLGLLRDNAINVKDFFAYRDHHYYTKGDINRILAVAREKECTYLITTEKDLVKLNRFDFADFRVIGLRIGIEFKQQLELVQKLNHFIDKAVKNV